MNCINGQNHFCNRYLEHERDEASWSAIVDLIFDVVAHRDRLALKRKATGRRKRRLARRLRTEGRPR